MARYQEWLGNIEVTTVPIPHDCTDGFLYAFWRRPAAYLDPHIRTGSSSFWTIEGADEGLERLRHDLDTGEWERRYDKLVNLDAYDAGYRLIVSR